MTTPTTTPDQSSRELELTIGGMTCASCAARIEKKLNKLDGVSATVNYATEKAKVSFPATLTPAHLVGVVEATGYTATLPAPASSDSEADTGPDEKDIEAAGWWQRLVISAVLTVPVLAFSMVPALQFDNWQRPCPGAGPGRGTRRSYWERASLGPRERYASTAPDRG